MDIQIHTHTQTDYCMPSVHAHQGIKRLESGCHGLLQASVPVTVRTVAICFLESSKSTIFHVT